MPSSEKEQSIRPYPSPKTGSSSDTAVTTRLSTTVRLRPMWFISMPVGTEKMRNQKNTSEGKILAWASVSARSRLT